ncbi:Type II inositol 3,4-bisphosphate 4-phosphatase [Merluccius polli]|uniref:Type II inositol 3,4-bisphosphate 4-phosphatase n=1 Tax=Merluccius polli TaxID=89951 RepID=A0AA47P4Z5_MERPO|nr:Type II inositol 3,4-bisphosphate 4-phosphatase [Merluccius polli]
MSSVTCSQRIGWYKETLSELNSSSSFKSSQRKADRHVQFVPTNLHLQRMEVCVMMSSQWELLPEHHMSFKHGGLKNSSTSTPARGVCACVCVFVHLPSNHFSFTNLSPSSQSSVASLQARGSRARALLASVAKLQPLIFGLSEEVLTSSLELSPTRLQQALDRLAYQSSCVHALKDVLGPTSVTTGNGVLSKPHSPIRKDFLLGCTEYDEEDWTDVGKRYTEFELPDADDGPTAGREAPTQEVYVITATGSGPADIYPGGSRQGPLLPLEGVSLLTPSHPFYAITLERRLSSARALVVLVCGVVLRVYESVNQPEVLLQFHTAGVLVQFEALLSTYGEEVGMLEDMEVGVSDLSRVAFCVTAATSDHPDHLLPTLRGTRGSLVVELRFPAETFGSLPQELQAGGLIRVHPVLFNIGINQNQSLAERFGDCSLQDRINQENCELLKSYYLTLRDTLLGGETAVCLSACLSSCLSVCLSACLPSSVGSRKRKNVEVLWLAASVCRRVHGVRVTSCKSAKDRTAMSVTLEQCVLLRDAHTLRHTHFHPTLDTMRRSHLSWGQMVACYARPWCSVPRVGPWVGAPAVGPQAPGCHLYPVIFMLVISHLLVLWLIISLLIALDYHEGCRMDNVQKNVGWRRYAFSRIQLLTFPKIYRPPAGTYSSHTNTDT